MTQAISIPLAMRESIKENTFRNERRRLLGFIRGRVGSAEEAEDILQDVFVQFISGFDTIQSIDRITSWLYRVARNKIVDRYRTGGSRPKKDDLAAVRESDEGPLRLQEIIPDLGNTPEAALWREAMWEEITHALDDLPPEQRAVFIAHELEDKSFREMADETGVPLNTLLSRKRYAILSLRQRLQRLYNEMNNSF